MNMAIQQGIFKEHLAEWLASSGDRKKRGEMAKEISRIAKVHKKSVSRSFRRVQMRDPCLPKRRGRSPYYTADVTAALKYLWEIAHEPCGELLHAIIAEYVTILKRDRQWTYGTETTDKLLSMSEATVKRRVTRFVRTRYVSHGKSSTKPGGILSVIPIRSDGWRDAPAGTMQLDTVAHCGHTLIGDFVYTVNCTDVATLWGGRRAQWNKGQEATVRSMEMIDEDVPFPILEWHPDSGSEFINWHCKKWSERRGQRMTRSRPNHKNDNCYVEERNGHIVRAWAGYARFDCRETVDALNAIYDVLTPYLNHFVPSKRIVSKKRIGARWKITREKIALPPYQRVLLRSDISDEVTQRLREEHERLNPLILKREIDRRLKRMFDVQKRCGEQRL
mgnify:CR=1 FL=1